MKLIAFVSSIFIVLIMTGPGQSHSLNYVENQLTGKGNFFQHFDRPAPDFVLKDIDGNNIAVKNFAGKIIVLFFTKAACPAHEIQSMINISPMRDLVQFVAVITDQDRNSLDIIRTQAAGRGVEFSNWTFLTGANDQLNIQVAKAVTHIIDREGRWRADFTDLKFQPIDFVVYINALINSGLGIKDGHGK